MGFNPWEVRQDSGDLKAIGSLSWSCRIEMIPQDRQLGVLPDGNCHLRMMEVDSLLGFYVFTYYISIIAAPPLRRNIGSRHLSLLGKLMSSIMRECPSAIPVGQSSPQRPLLSIPSALVGITPFNTCLTLYGVGNRQEN